MSKFGINMHSEEYRAGVQAANQEQDDVEVECPYAYDEYADNAYRRWMLGYWSVMSSAINGCAQ